MTNNPLNSLISNKKSIIGHGYGSEWHLLRWMGRHRCAFNQLFLEKMGFAASSTIEWLDFEFKPGEPWPDEELKGLECLKGPEYKELQKKWALFWPLGSGIHNWDAVGWIHSKGKRELLLIEAKAHLDEIRSDCKAGLPLIRDGKEEPASPASLKNKLKISKAFQEVKSSLNVPAEKDWTQKYYQYTNRIATLYFLQNNGIDTNLAFIYFVGDRAKGKNCPSSKQDWQPALQDQATWVGLPEEHALKDRIHKLFLHVDGISRGQISHSP